MHIKDFLLLYRIYFIRGKESREENMRLNKKKRRKLNIRENVCFFNPVFQYHWSKLYGLYGIYEGLEKEALELEKQIQQEKERQVLLLKDKDYYRPINI